CSCRPSARAMVRPSRAAAMCNSPDFERKNGGERWGEAEVVVWTEGHRWLSTHSCNPPECPGECVRRRIALLRHLLQAAHANVIEAGGQQGLHLTRRDRLLVTQLVHGAEERTHAEDGLLGQQLVKDGAQRIDVDGHRGWCRFVVHLLGRLVAKQIQE